MKQETDPSEQLAIETRRRFFHRMSDGLMGAAVLALSGTGGTLPVWAEEFGLPQPRIDLTPKPTHHPPRAQSVIHLCMQGGPSHVDLFDFKPELQRHDGESPPREVTGDAIFENDRNGRLMKSPFAFARHGQSGTWVSELLPHLAREVDGLAVIRSMYNVHSNHEPAIFKLQSGQTFPGHPTMGSWITYALGTENQNLPAYVVLADPSGRLPTNGVENWMSAYLPPLFQGTPMRGGETPLLNLAPDYEAPARVTHAKHDFLRRLDERHREQRPGQLALESRIRNYEMAARMQLEATEALDLGSESAATRTLYGIDQPQTDSFGRRCLLARRLVERGVRFVQLYPRGQAWDNHRGIGDSLPGICRQTDQPVAGLLRDLRQRGLLESTLVLWGGEFGRLPMAQVNAGNEAKAGRDHGPYGFTAWMAGGGVRGGVSYGSTDDLGYAAVEDRVSIQDWHATVLHLLGLDHHQLVYSRNGLGERLTHQFEARVVRGILT